jgi:hypothetical protein
VELLNVDVFGNIRRCQGLLRSCVKEINQAGHDTASKRIVSAIATMRQFNKFRVPYFQALLAQARKHAIQPDAEREIVRRPGNPMLRYAAGAEAASVAKTLSCVPTTSSTEKLTS